ncbi:MAG: hypothetical protein ASQ68_gp12 [Yellowstone Lake virophage 6]|uniref:hypothetical protein n=1 Tax=Yellowstone Lake virophage 6 TaxID=1557034 RepID=UPI000535B920|nr:MAG: hypothetical protein ASQ68_gp12 [Yellowstone Lake virophage 6]AIW01902.1 MAG: hypothetical protein YSLV6_ORF12 [Yellowstone Lake virophage 6]
MSYSNYQLSQRINNVQQQINNFPSNNNTYSGINTFNNDVRINSTLTDTSGDVGIAGQLLSSTGTGINWTYAGLNGYILYDLSSLPFTLPTTTYSNLYVLFTGTVGSGGILTIPISGFTTGTYLSIKNASGGTVNISTTSIPFTTASTSTAPYDLFVSETLSLYFNGSYWVQTSISNKIYRLTVTNSLAFSGALAINTITESSSGTDINLYGTTASGDILIGQILPAGRTLRLCNTTAGTSGGSVHCCNVGFDASHINNATTPAGGLLKLANSQTTGALYIGGGSASATRTTGPIIIGADSTASGGINIGTDTDLAVPTDNTINIGSASYATIIKGTLSIVGNIVSALTSTSTISTSSSISTTSGSISSAGVITGSSIIAPSLNASAVSTDVNIATTQTSGTLNIGTGARTTTSSSGNINIGTGSTLNNRIFIGGANSRSTIEGSLYNSITGYIAGASAVASYNSNLLPFSLGTTVMSDYLVRFTGTASGTLTIPSGYPEAQRITVKNTGSGTITVTFTGGIYATGATATSASIVIGAGGFVSAINLSTSWIQT